MHACPHPKTRCPRAYLYPTTRPQTWAIQTAAVHTTPAMEWHWSSRSAEEWGCLFCLMIDGWWAAGLIPLLASAAAAAIAAAGTSSSSQLPPGAPQPLHAVPRGAQGSGTGDRNPASDVQPALDQQQSLPRAVRSAVEVVAALEGCITEPRLAEYLAARTAAIHAAAAARLLTHTLCGAHRLHFFSFLLP